MSDFKLPDLPSDDELGISKEDLENFEDDDKPELSDAELAALLGEEPRPKAPKPPAGGPPKDPPKAPPKPPKPPKTPKPSKQKEPKPPRSEGPRSRWRGPAMFAALLVMAWSSSSYRTLPSPEPANAPDTAFSSARAMALLVEIARRPHPPGSPAHAQVRDYLLERLTALGVEPQVQTTTAILEWGSTVRAATVRNIIARLPGTNSSGTIVMTAHYDGREIARGAGDDGSGVVSILETLRALQAGPNLRNDVLVVITDAEELGLMGARAFVDEHPAMGDVRAVLSLEARGGGGPSIMFETGSENGWIVRALKDSGARPYANSMSYEVYKSLPNDTDFTPFSEGGYQGLNFAAMGRASVYHQNYDDPEHFSEATLQHHGNNALRVMRHLGATSLDEVNDSDVSFVSLPVLGLVVYDINLALPLAAALVVLALVVMLPVRRTGSWVGIFVGLGLAVLSLALSAGAGYGLMAWLPRFHPEFGSLHGSAFHTEGWYVAALVAFSLAAVLTLFGLARRRFDPAALAWGALLLPLLAMAYVAFRHPAAAMNLQIPLAGAYVGAALLTAPTSGRMTTVLWTLILASALPVLAVLVPVVEFVWIGLSFSAAVVLGAVVGIVMMLVLPALDRFREPNAWWAPVSGLVLAALCLVVGIGAASADAAHPAPSTLAYVVDHGTNEALWVTDGSEDPVDAEASAWAAGRAGQSFSERRSLAAFGFGNRQPLVAPGPTTTARPPELWTLSDTSMGGVRHLRLAVRSTVGAELLQFRFPAEGGTRLTALNGRPLTGADKPAVVEHWGTPDPVVILDLDLAEGTEPAMDVVEHLFRPQELLGEEPFQRPETLAPDIIWMSDRAVLRTPMGSLGIIPGPPPFSTEPSAVPQMVPDLADSEQSEGTAEAGADTTPGTPPDSVAAGAGAADTIPADATPGTSPAAAIQPDSLQPDTVPPDTVSARR